MKESILVVTEEPISRYLLRLILEDGGYAVFEADYGLDACNQVRQYQPDILIMDVKGQENDGFLVCKPNGEERPTALLPALLLNAKTQLNVLIEILHAYVTQFIPKPILGQELIDGVQAAVNNSTFTIDPKFQTTCLNRSFG